MKKIAIAALLSVCATAPAFAAENTGKFYVDATVLSVGVTDDF